MAWTLDGLDLGNVSREGESKDANLIIMTLPLSDASNTFAFDFSGAEENFTVEGTKTFASKANAQTFVGTGSSPSSSTLRGKISGNQQNTVNYISDFYNTLVVKVKSLDVSLDEGIPYTLVKYRITMILAGT